MPPQSQLEAPPEGFAADSGSLVPAMLAPELDELAAAADAALGAALRGAKRHAHSLERLAAMVGDNRCGGAARRGAERRQAGWQGQPGDWDGGRCHAHSVVGRSPAAASHACSRPRPRHAMPPPPLAAARCACSTVTREGLEAAVSSGRLDLEGLRRRLQLHAAQAKEIAGLPPIE